eukprot:scaffold65063_cov13-Tisochrysis_lutea.AAC.1
MCFHPTFVCKRFAAGQGASVQQPAMLLDHAAITSLELLEGSLGGHAGSLFDFLARAGSPMGLRRIKQWLCRLGTLLFHIWGSEGPSSGCAEVAMHGRVAVEAHVGIRRIKQLNPTQRWPCRSGSRLKHICLIRPRGGRAGSWPSSCCANALVSGSVVAVQACLMWWWKRTTIVLAVRCSGSFGTYLNVCTQLATQGSGPLRPLLACLGNLSSLHAAYWLA